MAIQLRWTSKSVDLYAGRRRSLNPDWRKKGRASCGPTRPRREIHEGLLTNIGSGKRSSSLADGRTGRPRRQIHKGLIWVAAVRAPSSAQQPEREQLGPLRHARGEACLPFLQPPVQLRLLGGPKHATPPSARAHTPHPSSETTSGWAPVGPLRSALCCPASGGPGMALQPLCGLEAGPPLSECTPSSSAQRGRGTSTSRTPGSPRVREAAQSRSTSTWAVPARWLSAG
mmetsp:Transcript_1240/g.5044  ORF Transcript_1240/g.5044 Transcript_1240/m.5044 type:complete len:229 (+) Transcript_1240:719-1405(+)